MADERESLWFRLWTLPMRYPRYEKFFVVAMLLAFFPVCLMIGWTMVKYPRFAGEHPGSDANAWTVSIVIWVLAMVGAWVAHLRSERNGD